MKKLKIAALILTYNEEINITACIKTLHFVDQVFVLDSFSNDNSVLLAKEEGAEVFQRKFDNYASQRNEALKAIPEQFDWVLMIDADERLVIFSESSEVSNTVGHLSKISICVTNL